MPDQETKNGSSARVQIIVALIGLAGVVATALIANWKNVFSKPATMATPVPASTMPSASASTKKSEHPVHSNGRLVVRATHSYNLDAGLETTAGADFKWDISDEAQHSFVPLNGAAFFVIGQKEFESIRWSEMEHFPYSTDKINRILPGTVVAYKTGQGRLGKLIVDDYGDNLTIRWRTYD